MNPEYDDFVLSVAIKLAIKALEDAQKNLHVNANLYEAGLKTIRTEKDWKEREKLRQAVKVIEGLEK